MSVGERGREVRVAVVGATGAVGSQIAELLGARGFPLAELKLFARDSSARSVEVGGRALIVAPFNGAQELAAFDITFLAIDRGTAAEIVAARPAPVLIDLSAATQPPTKVSSLVAPGLTARERVVELGQSKLFGVPHPAAQVTATILKVLGTQPFVAAAVLLSASAAGHESITKLFQQSADVLNARLELEGDETQVAFNVFPAPHLRELASVIAAQTTALAGIGSLPAIEVLRVPAFHGSAVELLLPRGSDSGQWVERLRSAPGLILLEGDEAASFTDAVGQEATLVRMSQSEGGCSIWCVFDATRLAALSAVWIAEALVQ